MYILILIRSAHFLFGQNLWHISQTPMHFWWYTVRQHRRYKNLPPEVTDISQHGHSVLLGPYIILGLAGSGTVHPSVLLTSLLSSLGLKGTPILFKSSIFSLYFTFDSSSAVKPWRPFSSLLILARTSGSSSSESSLIGLVVYFVIETTYRFCWGRALILVSLFSLALFISYSSFSGTFFPLSQ